MSFTNPVKMGSSTRAWSSKYTWSGGEKFKSAESTEKEVRPEIRKYDSETKESTVLEPRMKLAVVGVTTSVEGMEMNPSSRPGEAKKPTRFYSNEVLSTADQPITVYRSDENGNVKVFEGMYNQYKNEKPSYVGYQVNVYFYDFATKKVDRFDMKGSARGAWFDLENKNELQHKNWLIIRPSEKVERKGTTTFMPPLLEFGAAFTQDEIAEIVNSDAYKAYEKFEQKIGDGKVEVDGIDQTPVQYDGEGSQEYPDASQAQPAQVQNNTTDLSNVPF